MKTKRRRGGLSEAHRKDIHAFMVKATELNLALTKAEVQRNCTEGVLTMAVARLGGRTNGGRTPTSRGNFLQRIDQLRAIENLADDACLAFAADGCFLVGTKASKDLVAAMRKLKAAIHPPATCPECCREAPPAHDLPPAMQGTYCDCKEWMRPDRRELAEFE